MNIKPDFKKKVNKLPINFLPVIIGDESEMKEIMSGHFKLRPVISDEKMNIIFSNLPKSYEVDMSLSDQIENGYIVKENVFRTYGFSVYPLEFNGDCFKALDNQYMELGEYAILLYKPYDFIMRINDILHTSQPSIYEFNAFTPEYIENEDFNNYNPLEVHVSNKWKKEILMYALCRNDIIIKGKDRPRFIEIKMDSLQNNIGYFCKTKDLVEGRFPKYIESEQFIRFIKKFGIHENKHIRVRKKVFCEIMKFVPEEKCINLFSEILNSNTWKPFSFSEKLRQDGKSMPRLLYKTNDGKSEIKFGINYIEFKFMEYGENEKNIINKILYTIEKIVKDKFSGPLTELIADVGAIDRKYRSFIDIDEKYTYIKNTSIFEHALVNDVFLFPNIFETNSSKPTWKYTVKCEALEKKFKYLTADKLIEDFEKQDSACMDYIDLIFNSKDPYVKFNIIKQNYITKNPTEELC